MVEGASGVLAGSGRGKERRIVEREGEREGNEEFGLGLIWEFFLRI